MVVNSQKHGVGVFASYEEAKQAVDELKASGFPIEKISIIAQDADKDEQLSGVPVSDRLGNQNVSTATELARDTAVNSAWGTVLIGLSSLAIPGVGAVIAAGSVGVALVATAAGAGIEAVAANGLIKALTNLGIPDDQARAYFDGLHRGEYLVIVDGTEEEINRTQSILSDRGIQNWGIYNTSVDAATSV